MVHNELYFILKFSQRKCVSTYWIGFNDRNHTPRHSCHVFFRLFDCKLKQNKSHFMDRNRIRSKSDLRSPVECDTSKSRRTAIGKQLRLEHILQHKHRTTRFIQSDCMLFKGNPSICSVHCEHILNSFFINLYCR